MGNRKSEFEVNDETFTTPTDSLRKINFPTKIILLSLESPLLMSVQRVLQTLIGPPLPRQSRRECFRQDFQAAEKLCHTHTVFLAPKSHISQVGQGLTLITRILAFVSVEIRHVQVHPSCSAIWYLHRQ